MAMAAVASAWGEVVRRAMLETSQHYWHMRDAPEPRWGAACESPGACDSFGAGSGFCLVQAVSRDTSAGKVVYSTPGTSMSPEDVGRRASGPPAVLLSSNCRVARGGSAVEEEAALGGGVSPKAQLLHCPREAPVAVLTIPKCGTTSVINWVLRMDSQEYDSLARAADLALTHGPDAFMYGWLLAELNRTGGFREEAHLVQFLQRSMHRFRSGLAQNFVPPAHLCPACCLHGHRRQFVVVARNPYVRIASLFKYDLLNSDGHSPHLPWTRWRFFGPWLEHLVGRGTVHKHTLTDEEEARIVGHLMHLRPLGEMVRDRRFAAGTGALEDGLAHVVHLETLQQDLQELDRLLCSRFSHCASLPEFPQVLPGLNVLDSRQRWERCHFDEGSLLWSNCTAPPWMQLWEPRLRDLVARAYRDDFRWLGYSEDPSVLRPLRRGDKNEPRPRLSTM